MRHDRDIINGRAFWGAFMDIVISPSSLPLRWEGKDYKLICAGISNNQPYCEVNPSDARLEEEIKIHLRNHQGIKSIWKSGYYELI